MVATSLGRSYDFRFLLMFDYYTTPKNEKYEIINLMFFKISILTHDSNHSNVFNQTMWRSSHFSGKHMGPFQIQLVLAPRR